MCAYGAMPGDRLITAEQFERWPEENGYRLELVRGRIVREPGPAPLHARVDAELTARLHQFVKARGVGVVLASCGFTLFRNPDTVRVPDISYVCTERIPPRGYSGGFWALAPDLAVEILSPSNAMTEIHEKVLEYLDAGSQMVWVVDPVRRTITVYRSPSDIRILRDDEMLDGGEVLPGFQVSLSGLFKI